MCGLSEVTGEEEEGANLFELAGFRHPLDRSDRRDLRRRLPRYRAFLPVHLHLHNPRRLSPLEPLLPRLGPLTAPPPNPQRTLQPPSNPLPPHTSHAPTDLIVQRQMCRNLLPQQPLHFRKLPSAFLPYQFRRPAQRGEGRGVGYGRAEGLGRWGQRDRRRGRASHRDARSEADWSTKVEFVRRRRGGRRNRMPAACGARNVE